MSVTKLLYDNRVAVGVLLKLDDRTSTFRFQPLNQQ